MDPLQAMTTKRPGLHIQDNSGSPAVSKEPTTLVATYPIASQSTLNIESNNNDSTVELQASDAASDQTQQPWISYSSELGMVGCFALMAMMVSLDAVILVPVLPDISEIYHVKPAKGAIWPITVYFLANAAFQRGYVAMTSIFGRRYLLMGGISTFSIGLILLSAAPSLFPVLLIGRGVQGAGAASMVSIPHLILKDMISDKRRPFYNCIILSSSAIGVSVGLVLAGVFLKKPADWKWVFYVSAPFCFLLLISTPFAVKPVGERLDSKIRIMKVDWTGISMFAGSMASLLLGLTWASSLQRELKWEVLLALVAGAVGMIATVLYERSGASRPFLPLHILRISPVTYFCVFIQSIVMAVQIIYIPVYLRRVHGLSPTLAGAILIPMVSTLFVSTSLASLIPAKLCHFCWILWLGWALNIISSAIFTTFDTSTKRGVCALVTLVTGLAHGLTISATHRAFREMSNSTTARDASLIAVFIRTSGFCLAIAGAESGFRTRLAIHNFHSTIPRIYALSFDDLMRILTALAGFGGLLSLFVGWKKRRG
ncbi:hypothetical protein UA08_06462 [Talaromyces atroroseus]|uniref:Major facilitator superfamily (MFS) profile domain-containing protein n=1 Tax=Talaromyces atroroseus TaxID=1441469 RepID=A0A225ATT5_TALAT|nr:hypothetical protein UA08_06462 [Talaromyces atroroseus]OKL58346.1 hypothetical protein UA08_06462 [Talaromyces atroroseus]